MKKLLNHHGKVPELILTAGPDIGAREKSYTFDAVSTGWNSEHSKYLNNFEEQFAKYVGAKFAIATSSCTGALHLSLLSLGIGPGDEVIVPDITWVATASAVMYVGATPVFADVSKDTWLMTDRDIEPLITRRTRAIIPVHLYGQPADLDPIMAIAEKYNLMILEDGAQAHGAEYKGERIGAHGNTVAWSFYPGKNLGCIGDGGAITTNDEDLYQKLTEYLNIKSKITQTQKEFESITITTSSSEVLENLNNLKLKPSI
jgi:perosamine synthetase